MTTPNFQCARCLRFHEENIEKNTCDAFPPDSDVFPNGIPKAIFLNTFIHDRLFPKQENDLLFEEEL